MPNEAEFPSALSAAIHARLLYGKRASSSSSSAQNSEQ
jgi:hypothetical protein